MPGSASDTAAITLSTFSRSLKVGTTIDSSAADLGASRAR
jgi:hypothetical protein